MKCLPYICGCLSLLLGACGEPLEAPAPDPLEGCGWAETGETGGEPLVESPGFQDYLAQHVEQTADGQWIIEGDMLTDSLEVVAAHYRRLVASAERNDDSGFRSTAYCGVPGEEIDVIWNPAQKLAITYCFDASWDAVPEFHGIAEAKLAEVTLAWESATDINFVQLPGGADCSFANGALYEVKFRTNEPDDLGGYYGRASLPGGDGNARFLEFWARTFSRNARVPIDEVFTHETGHMIGLYHEMARFDQPVEEFDNPGTWLTCTLASGADEYWRGLTAPDPLSVMGYAQCHGSSPTPPYPSALDRTGASFLYNLSRPVLAGPMGSDSGTLVWHRPSTSDYVVWEPVGGGNQALSFSATQGCYDPACAPVAAAEVWKPLLYQNGGSVDVLMYGPGSYEDRRIANLDGVAVTDVPGTVATNTDVPVILDRYFAANDRSVWWIRPGVPGDSLWRDLDGAAAPTPGYNTPPFTDEHYSAVVGRLFGSASSVFWLSPTDELGYLTYLQNGGYTQVEVDKTNCGLENGVQYNAVPGDYDGDGRDEVSWYDFDTGRAWYWPQMPHCINASEINIGQGKLAAFRIGGTSDVLMMYRPQNGVVEFIDAISGAVQAIVPQPVDASPILRDFDTDGCTDILWFAPHLPVSQLWHSNCDTTFRQSLVQHPAGAYPLGYGLGHGRR